MDAFTGIASGFMGIFDGIAQEVSSPFDGGMEHRPLEQSAGKDTGKEVTRSTGAEGKAVDRIFVKGGRRRIVTDDLGGIFVAGDTGDDNLFGAHIGERFAQLKHFRRLRKVFTVGNPG